MAIGRNRRARGHRRPYGEVVSNQTTANQIALVNGRIVLGDRVDDQLCVVCANDTITGLVPVSGLDPNTRIVDVGGRIVTAGLIDLHAHGGLGYAFDDGTYESLTTILDYYASCGITSVQPSLTSNPIESMVDALAAIRSWMASRRSGCQVIGAHLEGPYFSQAQRGAHDPEYLRNPDDGTADQLLAFSDVISMFSLAPELPGATDLIRELVRRGVKVAAGHSDGRDKDLWAAADAGLSHVIHLWSGQSMTIREGPWRRPGMVEAALASDGLTAEIIADARHLPSTLMRLACRCLGRRLCAVSDASTGTGLPEATLFGPRNRWIVQDGVGMLVDGTAFAGSTTLLNAMIPVLLEQVGLSLPDAVAMATTTPARIAGIDHRKGSLEAGKDADLVVFNDDFSAWRTMIGGRWC